MDIVLVPGFWLNASSWRDVAPRLEEAGFRVTALTLPGLESVDADRSGIGLRDHVDAVVDTIDRLVGPIVLVGHSGGGAIVHAAVDARPDRIARAVYVDSGPLGDGGSINDELPAEGDEIPLPPWDVFEAEDLIDLDEELRARFRAEAIPEPRGVAVDSQHLVDERRYKVPVTVITCQFPAAALHEWIDGGHPYVAELARVASYEIVELPTGHWPQFTKPAELAEKIIAAVRHNDPYGEHY